MVDADIIEAVVAREGGYSNRPADRGGPTKFGVTLATLSAWRRRSCTAEDVKALEVEEAKQILEQVFVIQPGFGAIKDELLRAFVVDAAVNHGPHAPTMWLQQIAGVKQDGAFGRVSAAAINALGSRKACARFIAERVRFYGRIIAADARNDGRDTQADNAGGWLNRAAEFIDQL